jgi:hypothetical protein
MSRGDGKQKIHSPPPFNALLPAHLNMAKPKAATFPRLPRFRHAQQQQPNETHNAISIPRYAHEFPDHLQERVETSDIMLGVVAYLDIRFVDSIYCNFCLCIYLKR